MPVTLHIQGSRVSRADRCLYCAVAKHTTYLNGVQLCGAMRSLAEHWWWSPGDNNAELHRFHRSEPKQKMKVDIGRTICCRIGVHLLL